MALDRRLAKRGLRSNQKKSELSPQDHRPTDPHTPPSSPSPGDLQSLLTGEGEINSQIENENVFFKECFPTCQALSSGFWDSPATIDETTNT